MKNFQLVNPNIEGTIQTKFEGKTVNDAAVSAYRTISGLFSNNVPKFSFTLMNNDKYYHFDAKEKMNDSGKIKFTITENKNTIDNNALKQFIVESTDMNGGGSKYRYDDSSSSSFSSSLNDSSSDYKYFRPVKRSCPINYWSYWAGYPYTRPYYYVPQFVPTIKPYVYIKFRDT